MLGGKDEVTAGYIEKKKKQKQEKEKRRKKKQKKRRPCWGAEGIHWAEEVGDKL